MYHYVEQKRCWDKMQPIIETLAQHGIAYNNVHCPTRLPAKPMIELSLGDEPIMSANLLRICSICDEFPVKLKVRGVEERIFMHLLEVYVWFRALLLCSY